MFGNRHTAGRISLEAVALTGAARLKRGWGTVVTINYRVMLALAGLFMTLLAIATAVQGYFEHSFVVVGFQFVAAALLLYWAII